MIAIDVGEPPYFPLHHSHAACVTALCGFLFIGLVVSMINMRTGYRVMWICSLFCLMEVAGFSCRLVMLRTASFPVYTSMQVFLVVSPVFLCLINYIITGRLGKMGSGSEKKHRLVSWTFLFSDLLSLAIQAVGSGMSASHPGMDPSFPGRILLIVGIAIQLGFSSTFVILTISFHVKFALYRVPKLKPVFTLLYVTMALLVTRNLYRLLEFSGGWYSHLAVNEKYFYLLDSLPMFLAVCVYSLFHPGYFLAGAEIKGPSVPAP